MGNLINPVIFRLHNTIYWNSIWVSYQNKNYSYLLASDFLLHSYISYFIRSKHFYHGPVNNKKKNKVGLYLSLNLFYSHYKIIRYLKKILIVFFFKEFDLYEFFSDFFNLFKKNTNKIGILGKTNSYKNFKEFVRLNYYNKQKGSFLNKSNPYINNKLNLRTSTKVKFNNKIKLGLKLTKFSSVNVVKKGSVKNLKGDMHVLKNLSFSIISPNFQFLNNNIPIVGLQHIVNTNSSFINFLVHIISLKKDLIKIRNSLVLVNTVYTFMLSQFVRNRNLLIFLLGIKLNSNLVYLYLLVLMQQHNFFVDVVLRLFLSKYKVLLGPIFNSLKKVRLGLEKLNKSHSRFLNDCLIDDLKISTTWFLNLYNSDFKEYNLKFSLYFDTFNFWFVNYFGISSSTLQQNKIFLKLKAKKKLNFQFNRNHLKFKFTFIKKYIYYPKSVSNVFFCDKINHFYKLPLIKAVKFIKKNYWFLSKPKLIRLLPKNNISKFILTINKKNVNKVSNILFLDISSKSKFISVFNLIKLKKFKYSCINSCNKKIVTKSKLLNFTIKSIFFVNSRFRIRKRCYKLQPFIRKKFNISSFFFNSFNNCLFIYLNAFKLYSLKHNLWFKKLLNKNNIIYLRSYVRGLLFLNNHSLAVNQLIDKNKTQIKNKSIILKNKNKKLFNKYYTVGSKFYFYNQQYNQWLLAHKLRLFSLKNVVISNNNINLLNNVARFQLSKIIFFKLNSFNRYKFKCVLPIIKNKIIKKFKLKKDLKNPVALFQIKIQKRFLKCSFLKNFFVVFITKNKIFGTKFDKIKKYKKFITLSKFLYFFIIKAFFFKKINSCRSENNFLLMQNFIKFYARYSIKFRLYYDIIKLYKNFINFTNLNLLSYVLFIKTKINLLNEINFSLSYKILFENYYINLLRNLVFKLNIVKRMYPIFNIISDFILNLLKIFVETQSFTLKFYLYLSSYVKSIFNLIIYYVKGIFMANINLINSYKYFFSFVETQFLFNTFSVKKISFTLPKNKKIIKKLKFYSYFKNSLLKINIGLLYYQSVSILKHTLCLILKKAFFKFIFRESFLYNKLIIFFFETLDVSYLNSMLLMHNVIGNLKLGHSLNKIIYPIMRELSKYNTLYLGWKFGCFGRFQRRGRARKQWYKQGQVPLSTIISCIDYTQSIVKLRNGICSIKIYIARNINFFYNI